jgi:uncharacterized protein
MTVQLTWDEEKRQKTLLERGLDMGEVQEMFEGRYITDPDLRFDYGEDRFVTYGFLSTRLCAVVWTPRGEAHHIISLRKTNDREQKTFERRMG